MTPRELAEYQALRETIRERGTTRVWLLLATFVAWGALAIATAALAALPIATLLPLLVLAVGFETGFAVHTGVERIGRYIQVFFESDDADRGEFQARAPRTKQGREAVSNTIDEPSCNQLVGPQLQSDNWSKNRCNSLG